MREIKTNWRTRAAAVVAGLALAVGVGAAAVAPQTTLAATVTITSQTPEAANPNAAYNAYRLFTADIDNENKASHVAWDTAITDEKQTDLVTFLNTYPSTNAYTNWLNDEGLLGSDPAVQKNAQNALEFISKQIDDSADTSTGSASHPHSWVDSGTFADEFAEWVMDNLQPVEDSAWSGTTFNGDEGYYLFVTDSDSLSAGDVATAPIWFPLGGSATSIEEKALPPTIKKEVQEDSAATDPDGGWKSVADAEIGQEVPYRITVTTPGNYNTYDTFKMEITDTLPKGMTMSKDSVHVHLGSATGTEVTSSFAINYDDDTKVLTVSCNDTKSVDALNGLGAGGSVVITYTAKLMSLEGVEITYGGTGNENTAVYRFSNNPDSKTEGEISSKAKLYVYMVTVDKFDKATQQPLAGAQFVIRNAEGNYLKSGEWTGTSQQDATVFTTNAQGEISDIKGLDAGTYTLVEVKAPDNYATPSGTAAETTITITATYNADGSIDEFSGTATGLGALGTDADAPSGTTGTVNIDVQNDKTLSLAMTGAEGVGIGGAVVVAVGLGWYLVRRHRADADQA